MPVQIPDDSDFSSFRDQVLSGDGWTSRYCKSGVTVWCRDEESRTVQKLKFESDCPGDRDQLITLSLTTSSVLTCQVMFRPSTCNWLITAACSGEERNRSLTQFRL
ncbi:hypothetical protein INR49_009044 [Caranx melampygus]|nr:hypothetical protein INR49_009044 [Caranx melampygus]